MSKHSPGPFRSGGCVVYDARGLTIADLAFPMYGNGLGANETEANANLFVAGPEMLQLLFEFYSIMTGCPNTGRDSTDDEKRLESLWALLKKARPVIADAGGWDGVRETEGGEA